MMGCENCKHAPKTYIEYCISQSCPHIYCPDAYTERAVYCGNYNAMKSSNVSEVKYDQK